MAQKNGFTLVELAIALMVIGLLIGGVLKGQELIENARVTAAVRQLKAYDAAAMIFRNTYGAIPGDIKRPNRIPNCSADICNLPGNGNGKLTVGSNPDYEQFNFFPHLTKAGMIQGPEGGTQAEMDAAGSADEGWEKFFPENQFGYYIKIDALDDKDAYAIDGPLRAMAAIDAKMDDGLPWKGDIKIESCETVGDYPDGEYDTNTPDYLCDLWVRVGF